MLDNKFFLIKRMRHCLRCLFLASSNRNIRISNSSYFHPSVDLEVAKKASLSVSNGVWISKGSFVGVRDGASLSIGRRVFINRNTMLVAHQNISIGSNVTIGPGCYFFDHDHKNGNNGEYNSEAIVIDDNVWIGASVVILKGVHIGANSVISAGAVVTKNVPPNSVLIQKRQELLKTI